MDELPLRDIHLPPPVSWWPPAPGWWLLGALVVAMCAWWFYRRHQLRLRRTGLRALAQIESRYQLESDAQRLVQEVSALLRRMCLTYWPRERVASVTGARWRDTLTRLASRPDVFSDAVLEQVVRAPYDPSMQVDPAQLLAQTRRWMRALPPLNKVPAC